MGQTPGRGLGSGNFIGRDTPITRFKVPNTDTSLLGKGVSPTRNESLFDTKEGEIGSPQKRLRSARRSRSNLRKNNSIVRNSSRGSKEEGSFFEQKEESFMSTNSTRSRNRMRQRSMSRKSKSRREPSVKLSFTPASGKKKPKQYGSKRKSPFGHKPPVLGSSKAQNEPRGRAEPPGESRGRRDEAGQLREKTYDGGNPIRMLTRLKSDPEILKDVVPEDKKHYSELGRRHGNYFDARKNSKNLKMQHKKNVIRKKPAQPRAPSDEEIEPMTELEKRPKPQMNSPKRNSYQSFGEPSIPTRIKIFEDSPKVAKQVPKDNRRYPTFGNKGPGSMNSHSRLTDFAQKGEQRTGLENAPVEGPPHEVRNSPENPKNELFEMFNKKVKQVKSINGPQRQQRLSPKQVSRFQKMPSNQDPEPQPQRESGKYSRQAPPDPDHFGEYKSREQVNYRQDPIYSAENPKGSERVKPVPLLKSLESRVKNILEPSPSEIVQLMRLDNRGKIHLNSKAVEYLSKLSQDIKVVSVIGPYRSGKSFLLNRLNGRQQGFHIGNSTNPCTQGVWLWGVNTGNTRVIVVMSRLTFRVSHREPDNPAGHGGAVRLQQERSIR